MFQSLLSLIMKDTGGQNESPKLVGLIRFLLLSLIVNSIINTLICISSINTFGLTLFIMSFIVFLAVFCLSYKKDSAFTITMTNILVIAWVIVNIVYSGWKSGAQQYILILLILCFFTGYKNYGFKIFYSVFLFLLRIYLYFFTKTHDPINYVIAEYDFLQIANTFIDFFIISMIMYVFSEDSQALERKLIEYNNKLQSQANTDALTTLPNRRRGRELLENLFNDGTEKGFCVCICDIDFFKKVNDNYGHDVGDEVLKKLADTMKQNILEPSVCARWGGEEFLIIFPECNGDEAMLQLKELRQKIKDIEIKTSNEIIKFTMTFGLAEYDFSEDIDTILKEADEKLYIGKESGRDRIIF